MSTATLNRRRLVSLPADATWTQPQRPSDVRPCQTRPANWWDTGDPGNAKAKAICAACPFQDTCKPTEDEDVAGTIRAGVAYDDRGRPIIPCDVCGDPMLRQPGTPVCINGHGTVAQHHNTIAELREQGLSFQAIAEHIGGVTGSSVNRYWVGHLAQTGRRLVRVPRAPGVNGDTRNQVKDFHDVVVDMLSDLDAKYTYQEVAYAIGSTADCVKSYWRRHQKRQAQAGLPVINRRQVCNRPGKTRRVEVAA